MVRSSNLAIQTVDLTNCDREPIHIPGSVQPHGILLVLQEPELKIIQASANTEEMFGYSASALLGRNLETLLGEKQIDLLREILAKDQIRSENPIPFEIATSEDSNSLFDGILHRTVGGLVLELEPALQPKGVSFLNFYSLIRSSVGKLQSSGNLTELSKNIVQEIRTITEFDRVMLYRFNTEGHGEIVAEERSEHLTPYLGLHYPSTDVPKQARRLYCLNWLRLIPNANYRPSAIVPELNPITHEPLDLSHSILRSVSPVHIDYLHNMGVTASMSISILKNGKLWGLVACHHYTPKYVSYEIRKACELLGQVMSLEIVSKEHNEDYEYRLKLKDIQNQILEYMSLEENFVDGLVNHSPNILDLVNATGALICVDGNYTTVGITPEKADLENLIQWLLQNHSDREIFYTDSLTSLTINASKYKDVASGILAIPISKMPKNYLLWFRPEEIQTVNWAGNPNKPVEIAPDGSHRLTPRGSFELWKETVRFKSLPWKQSEIDAALALRNAIVKIILRQTEELAKLNAALQISEAKTQEKAVQLQHTLKELQQTQTQLIQSEKMSSLGQLVAGIAHEINNPINFIYGNISHASEYSKDLLSLIELYSDHYPDQNPEIEEEKEAIDFEFLLEDLPKLLSSMQVGADRIRGIVQSLRNFSRLDEAEKKSVNIHEGIDSTLLILQYRLKAKPDRPAIEVIKDYGDLPPVECYPGSLNQVLMNLLANAIDTLEEGIETGKSTNAPEIRIKTEITESNHVTIRVIDNGMGIPEKIKAQVFDPLFTTKPVGKGTGIGLAISYSIVVEKHGGQLTCHSTPGEGTEFVIDIPQKQS